MKINITQETRNVNRKKYVKRIYKRGEKMQEVKEKNEVREEDILKLAEMYKQMTPANRFFMVSASGLLLASQSNAEEVM